MGLMDSILTKMRREGLLEDEAARKVEQMWLQGTSLDEALVSGSGLSEEMVLRYLAAEFGMPYVDLDSVQPDPELLSQFPARILLERRLLPLSEDGDGVLVATSRAFDTTGVDELRLASGKDLRLALAPASEIDRCIKRCLGVGADTMESLVSDADGMGIQVLSDDSDDAVDLTYAAEDASIIRFVNQVLTEAIELRATDVHFEPFEDQLRVRYRIDGVLQQASIPPQVLRFQAAIVSRLKILSRLDIAEKRLPQDGRIKLKIAGREIDVRVSVIPMLHGEAVVLRLLDRSSALLGLENLGMSADDRQGMERILELPHGIVLVTGPTGSGKTTTLYAALSRINDIERKIITIEDPIEYHLRGINQIQVSTKAGLTFDRGLRSILRHDPDVILVGEIRDSETAEIAVQSSLTGHLVFSTLHTNDAPGALTRLVDMGVEPYLVASSLEAVLAQRLVRLICPGCRRPVPTPDGAAIRRELGKSVPEVLYSGAGCRACQGTGYHGRSGIFELMIVTEEIRAMILERASSGEIRKVAQAQGMHSLRDDGWRHVIAGTTTIEEVLRSTKDESYSAGPAPSGGTAQEESLQEAGRPHN
jgi:general secretion pathway protein E/type IV pilus assembly protein PilB